MTKRNLAARSLFLLSVVAYAAAAAGDPSTAPPTATRFEGQYCAGLGDADDLRLIDDSLSFLHANPRLPNLAMVYRADWDTFEEGAGWGGWWIQNSYGFSYAATPFLQEPWFSTLQRSWDLFWDNQGDGRRMGLWGGSPTAHRLSPLIAPRGCLGDCAAPGCIVYKQGDGNVKIHDWFYEATAAGIVAQAEILLASRDANALAQYLPKMELACDAIEKTRDPRNNLFLVGPACNLLAPSFGGVKQPDGQFGKAYLAGLSITYLAALDRMVELYKLQGDEAKLAEYGRRQTITRESLPQLLTPAGYFVKSIEPGGTKHGVMGQKQFGYLEGVANADAVALRVADDATARAIYRQIAATPAIRPFDFLLTNAPSLDDTYVSYGRTEFPKKNWIYRFGMWVNGGAWGTVEGRAILMYYRLGQFDDVRRSARRALKWAKEFRMDAPWSQRGENTNNPWSDTGKFHVGGVAVMIDNFAIPAATVRGLFDYEYRSDRLILRPRVPASITEYVQKQPVRFGTKTLYLTCRNGGPNVRSITVNGQAIKVESPDAAVLRYAELPDEAKVVIVTAGGGDRAAPAKAPPAQASAAEAPAKLPESLRLPFAVMSAMDRLLTHEPQADYERSFVRETLAAIEARRRRTAIEPQAFFRPMTPARRASIEQFYENAARAMYDGFCRRMARYGESGDSQKRRIARLFQDARGSKAAEAVDRFLPAPSLNPRLAAPVNTWDTAIPLGNGLLGGLLWGGGNTVRLSLDRGDLWDLRVQDEFQRADCTWKTIERLVAERNQSELVRRFDQPYNRPWPTKLPGGRIEITLDPSQRIESFTLDLAHAVGRVELSGPLALREREMLGPLSLRERARVRADGETGEANRLETFFSAAEPVALIRIPGPPPKDWKLVAPAAVKLLGYPAAIAGNAGGTPAPQGTGNAKWFVQQTAGDFQYAVVAETRRVGDATLLAVTIAAGPADRDVVAEGRRLVRRALDTGYHATLAPHEAWWRDFWHASRIELPEPEHLQHYYLVQYFYGAASRRGAPPMPLQGVWTADDGTLPPWKGDYHHDLNTQTTYIAYQTAGRFDEGLCFLEYLWKLLPEFRQFARRFYDSPGAAVPGVMTIDGKPLGGWSMYSLHPTNAAWLGFLFHQHWRYTLDEAFLRERAYPWCAEIGECLLDLLKPDSDGVLRLPLSSSPEIHDNTLRAWLRPNSNYDHDCMAALFGGLAEMADALGKRDEAAKWRAALAGLGRRAVDPQSHVLMLAPGENLVESHRHLAHSMSIHPFGLLTIDGSPSDREIIAATCRRYDELGTQAWCGYSFSWMACLRARAGEADAALRYLDIYRQAFILRNGFHANGDQSKAGYAKAHYHPFTLEGNFLASQAVHEMLLQSWGGVIRIFPATPARWRDAAFEDLRTEGGHRVSAHRENGVTTWLSVTAGRDDLVKIRDNFGGKRPAWDRADVQLVGPDWQYRLKAGQSLTARFD
jgi:alpha-L-fucosidase 2